VLIYNSFPGRAYYYPLLNLIQFYFHFGKYEEAMKIIDQALPLARTDEDALAFLKR
jgi:tetratricopeptide (TPR) repeat protein